jgi:cell division protein FtsA
LLKFDELNSISRVWIKELSSLSRDTSDLVFALDIGTRSVVGVIMELQEDSISVIDFEVAEHHERSMLDGQIHNVWEVAKVISLVKDRLEQRIGPLKKVSVAAAGRSLKTKRIVLEQSLIGHPLFTKDDVLSLELAAIQDAQRQLANTQAVTDFHHYYCVGYSVVNYYLDGEIIGNLVDQRGQTAKVDLIATFLPRVVVDSLMTALSRADLQMNTLTLEPIAAINVLIPASMRKINIALVDIGAGTSDIALTAEGTITAYGMVPIAGDEITEALGQAYLLDFKDAEMIKRRLHSEQEILFSDILGMEYKQSADEMIHMIETQVDHLAEEIANKILELNGTSPQAVMLIGGGSLTPTLPEKLAAKLQLPTARVAIRGTDAIKNLMGKESLQGPEFVTPLGIAVAAQSHPVKYLTVSLNGEEVRIFDLKKIQVGDVLLHAGWDIKKLPGRPGMAISVQVNGKVKFIPGSLGTLATITVNHQPAHLDTVIADQDCLFIEPGMDGEDANVCVKDLIEEIGTLDVYVNDVLYSLPPILLCNGLPCGMTEKVNDRDRIEVHLPQTLKEVIAHTNQRAELETTQINYRLNNQPRTVTVEGVQLFLNGKEAFPASKVIQGDRVVIQQSPIDRLTVHSLIPEDQRAAISITVTFNGEKISLPLVQTELFVNGIAADMNQMIQDGDELVVKPKTLPAPIYSDIFRFTNIDLVNPNEAMKMKTMVNGEPAQFHTELKDGDQVELIWENISIGTPLNGRF